MSLQTAPFQIYNASAGSGKTFTLVKSYLKILLQSNNRFLFQSVLAITFTNKASAEMKTRVLENLRAFSEGKTNDMSAQIIEETALDQTVLQKRAQNILQAILQNYSAFNITTIDSFTFNIVKTFAFDLKLPMNFEVEMDAQRLLNEAIDVLISKIGTNPELTNLLIDFSVEKFYDDKAWDITTDLQTVSKIILNEHNAQRLKVLAQKPLSDFLALKKRLQKTIKTIGNQFKAIGKQAVELIESQELQDKDFYYSMLPKHFKNLRSNNGKATFFDQSKLRLRVEENTFYGKTKPQHVKDRIEEILPQLLDLYVASETLFQEQTLYKITLESITPLTVLSFIKKELEQLKVDNNIRLNAEFNQLIHETIKDEPAPFIYERLGEKFRHYFIDEMQDTSVLQWQNLQKLIDNALQSQDLDENSGTLLLVGDAKQSIYRWRGSMPEQFIDLANDGNPFFVPKAIETLDTNYRSFSEVIDFNNQFFKHVAGFLKRPSYSELYEKTTEQEFNKNVGGYVQIDFLDKKADEDLQPVFPKKVLEIIQNLDDDFDRKDICVLVRKRKEGVEIAEFLMQNDVQVISSETLLLANNAKVNAVLNALKILQNDQDKEAYANFLLFLHEFLGVEGSKHAFLAQNIEKSVTDLFKNLQQYHIHFSVEFFKSLPFYQAVEYLAKSLGLMSKSDVYIQYFLDFIIAFQQKKQHTISAFLAYFEERKDKESIVIPELDNAVRIMTIHKSKGLEFPVVILPYDTDLYRQISPMVWFDMPKNEVFNGFEKLLLKFKADLKYVSDYAENLHNERREQLEGDNFNLLYVALTRAVEQLYIVTEKPQKEVAEIKHFSHAFVDFLMAKGKWHPEEDFYYFGNQKRLNKPEKEVSKIENVTQQTFVSSHWSDHQINVVTRDSSLWDTAQGEAISFGNLIHHILSEITVAIDAEKVIERYLFQGKIKASDKEKVTNYVQNVVNHAQLKAYFSPEVVVMNEREMLSEAKQLYIPDRLVKNGNEMTIIDYKTGDPHKKYHKQLGNYQEVLEQMQYKVVKKLLIYINDTILIEEIK